jgi:SAM-dependent methyltransferase
MVSEQSPDFPEYDGKTVPIWDNIAEWWDDKIGDGNGFQDYLIEPASERLLALKAGESVLDIACGAGRFTRRMATHGVTIIAIDHSEKFIKRAKQRTPDNDDKIEYRVVHRADDIRPARAAQTGRAVRFFRDAPGFLLRDSPPDGGGNLPRWRAGDH